MSVRRMDRAALVWGALFTMVGVAFLGQEVGAWSVRAEVLVPVLLMVAGVVLVLGGLTAGEDDE